jgi:hypothetical protein
VVGRSPSIRYGAASKLAVVDKKVTKRVPASIRLPRVGQPLAGKEADWGEYDIESTPSSHENGGELRSCEIVRVDNKQSHHWGNGVRIARKLPRNHPPSSG